MLQSDSLLTRSVTVQAWMDANGNDLIDSTEYASPVRTVQWIKASEVVASTSLTYPTPGDTSLTATVTLTPNLNEQQSMSAGDVKIGFTRPGSTATVTANATQDDTTRVWSASAPLNTGNWAGMPHIGQIQSHRYQLYTRSRLAWASVLLTRSLSLEQRMATDHMLMTRLTPRLRNHLPDRRDSDQPGRSCWLRSGSNQEACRGNRNSNSCDIRDCYSYPRSDNR